MILSPPPAHAIVNRQAATRMRSIALWQPGLYSRKADRDREDRSKQCPDLHQKKCAVRRILFGFKSTIAIIIRVVFTTLCVVPVTEL